MKVFCRCLYFVALPAFSQSPLPTEQVTKQIVISGNLEDSKANRDLRAGKIVIGKKSIADSGAQSVSDMLRREPSVTIGKDGRIGLLGMPAYTQILVDGSPPSGVDPLTLDLTNVERIEIIKSATAATGPFGVAGTINVIRRKAERRSSNKLTLGGSTMSGHAGVTGSLLHNTGASGKPWSSSISLSGSSKITPAVSRFTQTDLQSGQESSLSRLETILASADIVWRVKNDYKITFSPDIGYVGDTKKSLQDRALTSSRTISESGIIRQQFRSWGAPLRLDWQIADDTYFDAAVRLSGSRTATNHESLEQRSNTLFQTRLQETQRRLTNNFLEVGYNTEFEGGHEISTGIKLSNHREDSASSGFFDGLPDLTNSVFGPATAVKALKQRFFLQDDWQFNKLLALSVGLAAESNSFALNEGVRASRARFDMWSPTLHLLRKIPGARKQNVRISIARTFHPVTANSLLLRPSVDTTMPCATPETCLANSIDTPDLTGNPHLQPERALGINVSFTRGFEASSEVTVELYSRSITQKHGSELSLESVPWSRTPRYVRRLINLGDARIHGANIEGRMSAQDFWKDGPLAVLQGSIGFAASELRHIPDNDSGLDGQLPWRAKLGATYSPKSMPLKLGMHFSILPGDWQRSSLRIRRYQPRAHTLSADASWKISPDVKLIFNADNVSSRNAVSIDEFDDVADSLLRRETTSRRFARIGIRLEINKGIRK